MKAFAQHELLAPLVDNVPPKKKPDSGNQKGDGILAAAAAATAEAAAGGGAAAGTRADPFENGGEGAAGAEAGASGLITENDSSGSKGKGKGKAASSGSGDGASGIGGLFTSLDGTTLGPEKAAAAIGAGDVAADAALVEKQEERDVLEMVDAEEGVLVGTDEEDGAAAAAKEEEEKEEDVSVADLLANANRQAKVYAQAPGAEDGKGGAAAATLAFARQVCAMLLGGGTKSSKETCFLADEIEKRVFKVRCFKAAGAKGIVNDFMEFGGEGTVEMSHGCTAVCGKMEYAPSVEGKAG